MALEAFDCAHCDRRRFLARTLAAASGELLPRTAAAIGGPVARQLQFHCTHTGESVSTLYWKDGHYVAAGLAEIDHVLRDFRTGDVHPIDPYLLDLVHRLCVAMAYDGPVHV